MKRPIESDYTSFVAYARALERYCDEAWKQEPVAYPEGYVVGPCVCGSWPGGECLKCPRVIHPPKREWVGLTPDEKEEIGRAHV
mgnify:CR=1 FL=1